MHVFPMFLVILLVFVNRYIFGLFMKLARGKNFDEAVEGNEPTVCVVTPMFNEGRRIERTIATVAAFDYPRAKLEMVIVDDCSTDDSYEVAREVARGYPNIRVHRNAKNMGKRKSINAAVRETRAEIIVSIDSDVEVDPSALRHLLSRFTSPDVAAVGGRVHVSNANENWLTRMQAIKYFFGYEFLKNLERSLHTVMCLSGCLTAYRRSVLLELEPILENRNILGVPIKYGEDRFLTRQIVKAGYRTRLTLDAACFTVAPKTLSNYFSQQLRWRRSNIVDFMLGLSHAWRLHPFVCVHYVALGTMLIAYPFVVLLELAAGSFFQLACFNLMIIAIIAVVYALGSRSIPAAYRVHPVWFLSAAVVMPVTYVLFTPLALFTLDSSSWETRGQSANAPTKPAEVTGEGVVGANAV